MYNSTNIAYSIKKLAKERNVQIGKMLLDCQLSKNAISSMLLGSVPKADSLAKIADYLNCSTDYLLGRTDVPDNPNLKTRDKEECLV